MPDTTTLPRAAPNRLVPLVVLVVILLQMVLALLWMWIDQTPPFWDEAWYMVQGIRQHKALSQGGILGWYRAWVSLERTRPSLVPALTVPFYTLFGYGNDTALLINLAALGLLLAATYGLGAAMDNPITGLLAALIVGSYPVILGLTHILLAELVMVALVAGTLLALWRSNGFRHRGWSTVAGLGLGLGLLSKVFYVLSVIGPLVVTLRAALRAPQEHAESQPWHPSRNLGLAVLVALAIAAPWYVPNLPILVTRSVDAAIGAEARPYGPAHPLHWWHELGYLTAFISTNTSLIWFIAFGLGVVSLLSVRVSIHDRAALHSRHPFWFLGSSLLLGYVVFSSLRNQDQKHVIGVLPSMAVLTGWGLRLVWRRRQWTVVVLAGAITIVNLVLGTFPGPWQLARPIVPLLGHPMWLFYPAQGWNENTRYAAPNPTTWPNDEILDYLLEVADSGPRSSHRIRLGIIPDYPSIDTAAWLFASVRRNLPIDVTWASEENFPEQDFLVDIADGPGWQARMPITEELRARLAAPDSRLERLPRSFRLPDDSEIIIYASRKLARPQAKVPPYQGVLAADAPGTARCGAVANCFEMLAVKPQYLDDHVG